MTLTNSTFFLCYNTTAVSGYIFSIEYMHFFWLHPSVCENESVGSFRPPCLIWFWSRPLGIKIRRDRNKEVPLNKFHVKVSSKLSWNILFLHYVGDWMLLSYLFRFVFIQQVITTLCRFPSGVHTSIYGVCWDSLLKIWDLSSSRQMHSVFFSNKNIPWTKHRKTQWIIHIQTQMSIYKTIFKDLFKGNTWIGDTYL